MIIILESFSKEHIGSLNRDLANGNYQGFTPFLDSLAGHSLLLNGFANGKTSIQGIPAVLSGIPSLMNESYIQSNYSTDKINSLANLLKAEGYTSAFFHGGTNGTMGFDSFTKLAGLIIITEGASTIMKRITTGHGGSVTRNSSSMPKERSTDSGSPSWLRFSPSLRTILISSPQNTPINFVKES